MKKQIFRFLTDLDKIGVLIVLLICISWSVFGSTNNQTQTEGLTFKGETNKEAYILGEPVRVQFEFVNESKDSVIVPKFGVEVGSLKIFVANEDGNFKEYGVPGWGRVRGDIINLKPKQSHKLDEVTILWNWMPNALPYIFSKPGVYFIKGVSYIGENANPIESEPIPIVVNEPVGNDLQVWNQIKDNREIGYLMQESEFRTKENEKKVKLVREVELILEKYPESTYSSYLKPSLGKYKVSKARRKRDKEKYRQQ